MDNNAEKTALGLNVKVGAMICYINICFPFGLIYSIIVLVTDKTNKLPRFHAFQSLLLLAAAVALFISLVVMGVFFALVKLGILTGLLWMIQMVVGLGTFLLAIVCAIKAYNGEMFRLPVLGDLADKWSNP